MSLIAQCAYSTEENGKLEYMKLCHESLLETVDFSKHRLLITNNSQYPEAIEYLKKFAKKNKNVSVIHLQHNVGTADGINMSMVCRLPKEYVCKIDDDLTWRSQDWLDAMKEQIELNPQIGILGLRRDDVYGELIEDGDVLWNHDIFGTCTMFNHRMIDKVGKMVQFSQYGFDDNVYSVRSEAAGFRNAFMKNIMINNLDKAVTTYTEWKKDEAGLYLQEASIYMDKIKKGEISYYIPFD